MYLLETRTVCHARDLWKCMYYAHQTCEIYQIMPHLAPGKLWNPRSKTVLSKCSFIWNKGPVNIWNDHKAQKWPVHRTCKYFSLFLTLIIYIIKPQARWIAVHLCTSEPFPHLLRYWLVLFCAKSLPEPIVTCGQLEQDQTKGNFNKITAMYFQENKMSSAKMSAIFFWPQWVNKYLVLYIIEIRQWLNDFW